MGTANSSVVGILIDFGITWFVESLPVATPAGC